MGNSLYLLCKLTQSHLLHTKLCGESRYPATLTHPQELRKQKLLLTHFPLSFWEIPEKQHPLATVHNNDIPMNQAETGVGETNCNIENMKGKSIPK